MRWSNFVLFLGLVACSSQPRYKGDETLDGKMNSPDVEVGASNPLETMQGETGLDVRPTEEAASSKPEVAPVNQEEGVTAVAENPPVQRTTVVVNNGRLPTLHVASFWLDYPSDERVVSAIVDRLLRRPSGQALQIAKGGERSRICVENTEDEKNLFFGFLFSHLSKAFDDVRYAESEDSCVNAKVPDFTKSFGGAFAYTGDDAPNFLCQDEKDDDFHIFESLNGKKKIDAKITKKGEKDNSWHFKKFAVDENGQFQYVSGKTVLTLAPFDNKDGKISGKFQSSSGTFALSCRILVYSR